jgi:hypothetical protein
MLRVTSIGSTVDRLRGRLRRVGARPLRTPVDTTDLDALIDAIAPLQLPDEVETWWRTVDVASFPMQPFPRPCRPDSSLRLWQQYQDEWVGVTPRCLVPVAYDSMVVLSVDVDRTDTLGGDVFAWAVDSHGAFEHVAGSWVDVVECYVDVIDAGAYELRRGIVMPESEILDGALRARRTDTVVPPRYPARKMQFANAAQWPMHWQRASGIAPSDRRPRGRTLTIGDVLAAPRGARLRGTIVGRVVGLVGGSAGSLAIVDDRSGRLDIWCPAATCTWGPRLEGIFEFDVEAQADQAIQGDFGFIADGQRDITAAVLRGDLTAAQDAGVEFSQRSQAHRAAAIASAVRPAG